MRFFLQLSCLFSSHSRAPVLFVVAFNVPVYSSFCCGAALFLLLCAVEPFCSFLLLWAVEPFSAVFAVSSRTIVKVGAVVLC